MDTVPLDTAFTSPKALQGLPNADLLAELGTILDRASVEVASLAQHLARDLAAFEAHRHKLLSEWEDTKAANYRAIDTAAKRVSRKLRERVRVEVRMAGNIEPLERLLREKIGGNLTAALDRLQNRSQLSLPDLAARCREGRHALTEHYGIPPGAADRSWAMPSLFWA